MPLLKQQKIDFNVWKITLINIKSIISSQEYKKSAKEYLQKNFDLPNWTFKTGIKYFPFFIGFSGILWLRYEDQVLSSIFSKTLPITKISTEKISWESFQFLQFNLTDIKKSYQFDIYPTSYVLNFEKKENTKLVGIIIPKYKLNKKETTHFLNQRKLVFTDTENLNLINVNNIYYHLDELPSKIEHFIEENQKQHESIFQKELKTISTSLEKLKKKSNKPSPKINKIIIFEETKKENLVIDKKIKQKKELKNKNEITTFELNSFFYKNGIFINTPFFSYLEKTFLKDYCSIETIQILETFLPITQSYEEATKIFAGYKYPDCNISEIYFIKLQNTIQQNKNIQRILIKKPVGKSDSFLFLNLNSCSPLLITHRKDNFIALQSEDKSTDKKFKNYIIEEGLKRKTQTFEDVNDIDPDSWFLQTKDNIQKGFQLEHSKIENLVASILKKRLENTNTRINLFLKIKYHFPEFRETFIIKNLSPKIKLGEIYKRIPTFQTLLKDNVKNSKKIHFTFFEAWEPISTDSWLLITQFSIGLFLLQLIKDLYKDYGKELIEYALQYASSSGIDVEELKEQYLYEDQGYRLLQDIKKNFNDIAGVDKFLLEIVEIVWFLRNKGRSAKLKTSIPKGILLTGPPGTGKTLLVQAIAGEAKVPIIVESGSLLNDPQQKGRGAERLKKIFNRARNLSPCIIFIDEIDTLGEKRQNIIQTAMEKDELVEILYENSNSKLSKPNSFIPQPLQLDEDFNKEKDFEYQLFRTEKSSNDLTFQNNQKNDGKNTNINLLTQFLVELDGLKERQGVIIIGATNRPNVLDPALIRPGRFDKVINLELPGKQKRIEILKLYSNKLKSENNISWDYLANRTKGFSAADIATAMNESTIQSIINKTTHTIETIEKGINIVTSYNTDSKSTNLKIKTQDPFFKNRLAFYQSGKALIHSLLENHPSIIVLHLWPRQKNARHNRLYENVFFETTTKKTLEAQLIGLYAGKAAEILPLYGNRNRISRKRWQSNIGNDDLIYATFLGNLLVDKWYFYSLEILIRKTNSILQNRNEQQFFDNDKLNLSKNLENTIEDELEIETIAKLSRLGKYQQRGLGPWWQIQVSKQTSELGSFFGDWYRVFLPDPEENILNLEWIPPDEYYHNNKSLQSVSEKTNITFNELYKIERDYVFQGLMLNSFNKAFSILDEYREFVDYFADYLLRFEIIRENEILRLFAKENIIKLEHKDLFHYKNLIPIKSNWGTTSRRKNTRFIPSKLNSKKKTK